MDSISNSSHHPPKAISTQEPSLLPPLDSHLNLTMSPQLFRVCATVPLQPQAQCCWWINSTNSSPPTPLHHHRYHQNTAHHYSGKDDNPLAMAHLEHYISQGLSFKFDGEQDKLIPWVKKFHAMRSSALWREATYVTINNKTYDLLVDFTNIKEHQIRAQAKERWTIENQIKSLKQDHPHLFYPRILGNVVTKSVTDEFYTTL
jgi:hypothetical protein